MGKYIEEDASQTSQNEAKLVKECKRKQSGVVIACSYGDNLFCLSNGTHIFEIENIVFAVLPLVELKWHPSTLCENTNAQVVRSWFSTLAVQSVQFVPVCICVTACHPGSACLINGSAVIHCCYQTDDWEGLAQHVFI